MWFELNKMVGTRYFSHFSKKLTVSFVFQTFQDRKVAAQKRQINVNGKEGNQCLSQGEKERICAMCLFAIVHEKCVLATMI